MADTTARVTRSTQATLRDYIQLLRPQQWIKNVVVFAGPTAGLKLFSFSSLANAFAAFGAFCLAASAIYAINDTVDRHADAEHPTKRNRPLARGVIQPAVAIMLAVGLIAMAMGGAQFFLGWRVTAAVTLYFVMMLAYSLALKEHVILDVIIIACGFVIRAWAGAEAVGVDTSKWLIACVFTLCLFLGFGKRRCEVTMLSDKADAGQHRKTLLRYTSGLLDHLITVSAGIAVVTFLLYTMDSDGAPAPFNKELLFYTLPVVVYGIFRYAMLTELGTFTGPTEIILHDRWMVASILLWGLMALGIVYHDPILVYMGLGRSAAG